LDTELVTATIPNIVLPGIQAPSGKKSSHWAVARTRIVPLAARARINQVGSAPAVAATVPRQSKSLAIMTARAERTTHPAHDRQRGPGWVGSDSFAAREVSPLACGFGSMLSLFTTLR